MVVPLSTATFTSPREIGAGLVAFDLPLELLELVPVEAGTPPIVLGDGFLLSLPLNTTRTSTRTTTMTPSTPPTIISVVRSGDGSCSSSATAVAVGGGLSGWPGLGAGFGAAATAAAAAAAGAGV